MVVAVVGSRGLQIEELERYLPPEVTAIVSGGAQGVDACARRYAEEKGLPLTEFLPDYGSFGRAAPLKRNEAIVNAAELVIAFWDGKSRGTRYTIEYAKRMGVQLRVFLPGD